MDQRAATPVGSPLRNIALLSASQAIVGSNQAILMSVAALTGARVIVVPGRQYRGIMLAINSPLRGQIRGLARAIRRRFHAVR